jgi:hypothetical protein
VKEAGFDPHGIILIAGMEAVKMKGQLESCPLADLP